MKALQRGLFLISTVTAALAMSHSALAESQYGYNAAGTGPVTAQARLNIEVKIPLMILLRVGSSGATIDTVALQGGFNPGIPGGLANAALADGSNQATGWDGTAPTFEVTSTTNAVKAYAWTNASGGGKVDNTSVTITAGTPSTGLTSASIAVASAAGLAHPGTNLGTNVTTNFARNTAATSTWTYTLTPAALSALNPGSDVAQVTYTATTL